MVYCARLQSRRQQYIENIFHQLNFTTLNKHKKNNIKLLYKFLDYHAIVSKINVKVDFTGLYFCNSWTNCYCSPLLLAIFQYHNGWARPVMFKLYWPQLACTQQRYINQNLFQQTNEIFKNTYIHIYTNIYRCESNSVYFLRFHITTAETIF